MTTKTALELYNCAKENKGPLAVNEDTLRHFPNVLHVVRMLERVSNMAQKLGSSGGLGTTDAILLASMIWLAEQDYDRRLRAGEYR